MSLKTSALQTLTLIDLTSLNAEDDEDSIRKLCSAAKTPFGEVAAICIFRKFIPVAKKYFTEHQQNIKIATVTNFPAGNSNLATALKETEDAIKLGADEIDIVFPYQALINGNHTIGEEMVKNIKQICGDQTLKVIIESGALGNSELIQLASDIAITNGADFIKTSTGKIPVNATLSAATIMLNSIKKANSNCGFKASGGIRLVSEAEKYLQLAIEIMGPAWIKPENFRFGASSLLTDVLTILSKEKFAATTSLNNY